MSGALQEVFARFKVDFDSRQLLAGSDRVDNMFASLQKFSGFIAGGVVVGGITSFINSIADTGGHIDDMSKRLGVTAAQFQALEHAARLGGLEDPSAALQAIANKLSMASDSTIGGLRRLGVATRDARGGVRPMTDVLTDLAGAFEGMEPAERARRLTQMFGRQGAALAPMLADGRESLQGMLGEVDALGAAFSEEGIENAAEYGDAMARLSLAFTGIKAKLAVSIIPTITKLIGVFTRISGEVSHFVGKGHNLDAILTTIGIALGGLALVKLPALIAAFAPLAAPIAILGLLYLAVDDVMTALDGGDSVLGRVSDSIQGDLIPSLQGMGGAFEFVGDMWAESIAVAEDMIGWFANIDEHFANLGRSISAVYDEYIKPVWDAISELSGFGGLTDAQRQTIGNAGLATSPGERAREVVARDFAPRQAAQNATSTGAVTVNINGDVRNEDTVQTIARETRRAQEQAARNARDTASRGGR